MKPPPIKLARSANQNSFGIASDRAPIMTSDGTIDYICAGCDTVLATSMHPHAPQIVTTLKCPKCGTVSDLPTAPGNN